MAAGLLGGVLLWQVMFRSQGEVSIAFMEDVWSRNLLNVFASPLTKGEYLLGMIAFGFVYPVAILPGPMQAVAALVPASHVFEGMRWVVAGHGVDTAALAAAAGLDLLYLAGAVWFFQRMLATARRTGGLARFAE